MGELMYWLMFLACVSVLVMAVFVLLYFREYARKVDSLENFKMNLERLEIIKKALDVQKLEELQERKKLLEREIEKIES